ncbi:MAG: fucose isomerase [Flexilinea sp.]
MSNYKAPKIAFSKPIKENEAFLIASGDSRLSANQACWKTQENMEKQIIAAFEKEGLYIIRGHEFDPVVGHGFISSQRMGMDVFKNIHPNARIIVAESVWQYSYHVLAGLKNHRGSILTVANWSGEWPGLVGLLNLNGCLTKMGIPYSTIWSNDFTDDYFVNGIKEWIQTNKISHDESHVCDLDISRVPKCEKSLGNDLAEYLQFNKAIIGIFDEGCMGMYNAIIEDELLNPMGIYKERLSQSALIAEMRCVPDDEARVAYDWLIAKGVKFNFGSDETVDLTESQVLDQMKMYIAAVRIADKYGCDTIGIQYQLGLKDMAPASDLVEGLLNNVDRPPVLHAETRLELYQGEALPHFNEVDEGCAVDALATNWIWKIMGLDPAVTLHDIRWGEHFTGDGIDDFVWVFQISGAVPPSHIIGGYQGASCDRQTSVFFPYGGATLKGVGRSGEIVWSRVYLMDGRVHADIGRGRVVELPDREINRRWNATTLEWPLVNAILYGVSRNQLMGRHKANHIIIAYGNDTESAEKAMWAKAAMFNKMGIQVHLCGDIKS